MQKGVLTSCSWVGGGWASSSTSSCSSVFASCSPPSTYGVSRLDSCEQRKVLVLTPYKTRWVLAKLLHCTVQRQGTCKILLKSTYYRGRSGGQHLHLLISGWGLVTRSLLPCWPYWKHRLWRGEGSWPRWFCFNGGDRLLQMRPAL